MTDNHSDPSLHLDHLEHSDDTIKQAKIYFPMDGKEFLRRKIFLKDQLIKIIKVEIIELQRKLNELERTEKEI